MNEIISKHLAFGILLGLIAGFMAYIFTTSPCISRPVLLWA
jgi:hypothetical protein